MTKKEHIERHQLLHEMLDELAADYLKRTRKPLGSTSVIDLLEWSFNQTNNPDDICEEPDNTRHPNHKYQPLD